MDELARPLKGPCTRDDECVVLDPFPLSCGDGFVLAEICPYGLLAANLCALETRLAPLRAEGCQACARFGCTGDHVAFDCGTPLPHCIDGVCAP
ncbi:MAG: hypothetical protein IT383_23785 [Deltaproteobacteria bacterium]|nr:hypothetical protein [Deltaproteobacteria bacterium]